MGHGSGLNRCPSAHVSPSALRREPEPVLLQAERREAEGYAPDVAFEVVAPLRSRADLIVEMVMLLLGQVTHELTPHHAHTRRRRSGGGRTAHGVDTQCDLQKRATSPSDQGASLSELRLVSIAASLPGEVSAGSLNALLRGFSVVSQHGAIQGVISREYFGIGPNRA